MVDEFEQDWVKTDGVEDVLVDNYRGISGTIQHEQSNVLILLTIRKDGINGFAH
jgi:hypothetical protein